MNSEDQEEIKEDNLKHLHKNVRHYVRCEACFSNPNVVKIFSRRAKVPSIAQEEGTIFRKSVVSDHLNSEIHREAMKKKRLMSVKGSEKLRLQMHNWLQKLVASCYTFTMVRRDLPCLLILFLLVWF